MALQSNIKEPNDKSDVHTRSRYERIIKNPDRLTY